MSNYSVFGVANKLRRMFTGSGAQILTFYTVIGQQDYNLNDLNGKTIRMVVAGQLVLHESEFSLAGTTFTFNTIPDELLLTKIIYS
jgi:hypothetical protein